MVEQLEFVAHIRLTHWPHLMQMLFALSVVSSVHFVM